MDGTAKAAQGDYVPRVTTVMTLGPGVDAATIAVDVNGETLAEAHETVTLKLSAATNGTLTDTKATGIITNDDGTGASLSVSDVAVLEGNAGTTNATFTVNRSSETSESVTVGATVVSMTAFAGADYTATTPVILTFAAGETTKTVPFNVVGDPTDEPNETLALNLSAAVNATIVDASGLATIVDDDGGAAVFPSATSFSVSDVAALEGDSSTTDLGFVVTRAGDTTGASTVKIATANGTAIAPADYTAIPVTTVTFGPGDSAQLFTVAVNGDEVGEAHETFTFKLSGVKGAVVSDASAIGNIVNDDGGNAQLSVSDVSVDEGDEGTTTPAGFVITRNGDASEEVKVTVVTANKTAFAGSDYQAVAPVVVTMAPGVTSVTVPVTVLGDNDSEPKETFQLKLSKPLNATVADNVGFASIVDDDAVS